MSSLPENARAGASARPDATYARARGGARLRNTAARAALSLSGLAAIVLVWWPGVAALARHNALAAQFGPLEALRALPELIGEDRLVAHIGASLRRIAIGLAAAMAIGVPLGFLIGRVKTLESALSPAIQFLRMISPLAWMPIAVMSLGVGDPPVYFLLGFAAVWPILMNTTAGVQQIDARWVQLGESLAATRVEMIWHIYLPGIAAHVLTGVRLAIGVSWIVLVPAEMLGVSSGLGYLILDTRDRLAWSELMAVVLVIGALGFMLDHAARRLYGRFGGIGATGSEA